MTWETDPGSFRDRKPKPRPGLSGSPIPARSLTLPICTHESSEQVFSRLQLESIQAGGVCRSAGQHSRYQSGLGEGGRGAGGRGRGGERREGSADVEERACLVSEPLDSTPGSAAPTVTLAPSVTTFALNLFAN